MVQSLGKVSADADGRQDLRVGANPRNHGKLGPQRLRDVVRGRPLGNGLQTDEHDPGVDGAGGAASAAAHAGEDVLHVGILRHDCQELFLVLHHRVERNPFGGFGKDEHRAGVLVGQESFGDLEEEVHRAHQHERGDGHGSHAMAQSDLQSHVIGVLKGLVAALEGVKQSAVLLLFRGTQEAAAQHGREGERDKSGHQDGRADGHGEFVKQPAENPAHKQDRNENRRKRQRHGKNREAHLARAVIGRFHHRFAMLHVADDVFEHDDGIVHDKADRQGQRHEGKIVERVVQQIHDGEGADDGHRQRQARDNRRRKIPQKQEDNEYDQADGQEQSRLDVVHRIADGQRAVVERLERNGRRELQAKHRQELLDVVHDFDGVGAGLPLNRQDDGALQVEPARHLVVFNAVHHAPQFLEAHRRAFAVGDDDRTIRSRAGQLSRSLHGDGFIVAPQCAGGEIHVGALHRRLHFVNPNLPAGQLAGIELHAHGILLRAIHHHLGHAADHRDALRHEGFGKFVHLGERLRLRAQRQVQNRLVSRVHFRERGRAGHVLRQLRGSLRDGRLHVLGGRVEIALQVKLQRDLRGAKNVRRHHRVQALNGRKLPLQRSGYRGSHRLGTRAGQIGEDQDSRKIHVRQVVDRQGAVGHHAE